MKVYALLFSVSLFIPCGLYAGGHAPDTVQVVMSDTSLNFDANLDSLLNLYYTGKYEEVNSLSEIDSVDEFTIQSTLTDSVIIDRLRRIPSAVDLSYNPIVRRYIDVYAERRKDQVGVMLGTAEYYFPIFDQILDYYGLPNELKYMSIIESALNPRAYSRARAVGLWQFMYGTGKRYGLTINSLVDERMDPFKACDAACRFMSDLYSIYQDWSLVIAAYNCGPGNVNKAIRRSGGKRNYWEIYYYLPRETRGYVPAFIGATYVMNYYREHNIIPQQARMPLPIDTLMITKPLHLGQVAEVLNIPIKEIRDLNPQYFRDVVPSYDKSFPLALPMSAVYRFIDLEDSIYAYKDSIFFNAKSIQNPAALIKGYVPGPPDNMSAIYYKVKSGDNLGAIAMRYGVRVSDIQYWNGLHRSMIRTNQKLVIYVPKKRAAQIKQESSENSTVKSQPPVGTVTAAAGDFENYTVKSGDSLWEITQHYPGVTEKDILELNNLSDPDKIKPGQVLKIRKK
jgi:membrane-bound lytic murein transglycosylase D